MNPLPLCDVGLIQAQLHKLKRKCAPALDNICTEHLIYSHSLISVHISMLFNVCLTHGFIPEVESRTQGSRPRPRTQKNPRPRPRTAFPRTDTLEAKDRNARGQGQGPRTQSASALPKKKKKRSSQKFFKRSPLKNVFQKIFQALHKILTFQKIVLSSSRGQANFRGLEALALASKVKSLALASRPQVLENWPVLGSRTALFFGMLKFCVLEAKDVLEDSTSALYPTVVLHL